MFQRIHGFKTLKFGLMAVLEEGRMRVVIPTSRRYKAISKLCQSKKGLGA